jgi:hypothetical protein
MATSVADTVHPWADDRDRRASPWRVANGNLMVKELYNRNLEE